MSAVISRKKSRDPANAFAAGDSARFSGQSADRSVSGEMDVKVVDPWSNKNKVTHSDKSGTPYEGASRHLPTARVERPEQKHMGQMRPAKQFEAYHHTLSKK